MIDQSIRLNTSIMLSCLKAIIPEQVPAVAAISCLGHAVCLNPVCPGPPNRFHFTTLLLENTYK